MKSLKVMSRYLILLTLLVFSKNILAQVKIGNNPKVMLPGALLELEHDSKALVITRVTTSQMNAIQANEGMLVYNTTDSCIYQRTSTAWKSLCSGSNITSQNLTNGRGIIVMDGTGAVLRATSLRIDSSEIAKMMGERPIIDTLAKLIGRAPIKDSIIKVLKDSISTIIQNGNITGKNALGSEIIKVNGGTGAVLKDMNITVDTAKMMTLISNNLNKSPIKDSLSTSITNIINNGTVTGKNMTSGSLVTLTGTPTGSLLKDVNIDINASKLKDSIASWINDKPISDSVSKFVITDSLIIKSLKDSVINEFKNGSVVVKDMTNGDLIKLTGKPIGSLLNDVKVDINTAKMKDSIAAWVNKKPISDSITKLMKDSISSIITSGVVTGKDISNGNGIIVTGGTGAALKATSLRIDSTAIAKMMNQSPVKDSVTKLIRDSISSIISNGAVTGKNATQGSLITVTGGTGAVLKDMKVEADTNAMKTFIANNLNSSPIKDSLGSSITNIINNNGVTGKNATQGSLITVTGGTGAVLKDMKVEADTNAMKTFIANNLNSSPIKDSLGSSITNIINNNGVTGKDISNGNGIIVTGGAGAALKATSLRIDSTAIAKMMNQSPVKDSITKLMKDSISTIITSGSVTGRNATQGSLITVTGGTGAVLKDMKVEADTNAMKTFIANNLNSSPIKDSLGSSITNIINNNGVTGKNATQGSLITVTGGTGAVLKDMKVEADTTAMKTFIANNLNSSPIKDSLGSSITNIINNNGVTGKDISNGNGIIVTGGTGAALKATSLRIDSTAIAKMMNQSPVKDSITKLMKDSISTIITSGSVTGRNATQGSLITVTGGTGAVLKDMKVEADTNAMKTFIANNLNSSPIKDSLGSSITNIINNNGVTGKDISNGNGIIVTGGTGAALKATSLRIDSTAIAKMMNQSPVKDSITKLMKDSISSIITSGSITGKSTTAGSLITVTNGSGAALKDNSVAVDTNAMKTFIANNLNSSPIKDSLGSSITNIINNNGVTGKDISNGNGIIVTGGAGAALKATSLRIDSTAIAKMINQSPVKDSVTKLMKDSISSIITSGAVSGKALTGVGINVSANGATSLLKDVTITWDSTAVYSKIKADSVAITNAIIATGSVDLDKDSTNEIQKLTFSNNFVKLSKGGDSVNLASLIIDTTSLSNRINTNKQAIIDTASALTIKINTNKQAIIDTATSLRTLVNTHIAADLDIDSTNEIQKLTFSNNVVKLSKGGDSVNLASLIIDTTSLSNRINTNKQAIIDTASALTTKINTNKQAIIDTATSLRTLVNTHITADLDIDSTNEIQKLTFSNNVVKLSKGGDSVNLASLIIDTTSLSNRINTNKQAIIDTATSLRTLVNTHITADLDIDSTNEIQKLSFSNNFVKLSKGGDSVNLASLIIDTTSLSNRINTNKQAIIDTASALTIKINTNKQAIIDTATSLRTLVNTHIAADLDIDSTNEIQKLTFSNNVVKLSKGGDSVNLASLIIDTTSLSNRINTNKQAIIDTATSLRTLVNTHIAADLDIDSTNEIQKLSLSGNVIKLSKNGDSVSIAAFKNMANNGTSISGDSVVLGGTLDRATTITTSATNTLTLAGLQSGASSDSIMTDSAGVVRHRSISTLKKEKVVVFTASYTVLADDEILIYRGTGPTATHTLTLPSAAANKDRVLQIVNMGKGDDIDLNLSTSILTIGGGTDITESFIRNTVSGAGYGAGASFGNTMKIVSDGTQWIKIGL